MKPLLVLFLCGIAIQIMNGCATPKGPQRHCTKAGQPAREGQAPREGEVKSGDIQCHLIQDKEGQPLKDGPYIEWYPDGKPALSGEYKAGKKTGKWLEWDIAGKKTSERWFEDGVQTITRASPEFGLKPVSKGLSQPSSQKPQ